MIKKQIWLLAPLTLSLILSPSMATTGAATGKDTASDIRTLTRVSSGQNGDLMRYHYVDKNGNEMTLKGNKKATAKKRAVNLPSSYDSREENDSITPIKDQGYSGCCWAFSSLKALEATSILKGITPPEQTDYSENHLAWYTYTPLTEWTDPLYGDSLAFSNISGKDIYNLGGNPLFSCFTLANWWGAAKEEDAPFSASSMNELREMASNMNNADADLRLKSAVHLKESNCYDTANRNDIKQAIIDYGALSLSFYMPSQGEPAYRQSVYENDGVYSIYGTQSPEEANHCVTIIGWDDNFNTFTGSPDGSGAWLIANSYGDTFGMDGCFWLSYYDSSLTEFYSFEAESADTYNTNFQYDGAGWGACAYDTEDIAYENLFTNTETTPQRVEAAGIHTISDNQAYKIEILRNAQAGSPTDGTVVENCTVTGTIARAGYHTVPLTKPVTIGIGESFLIRVTFIADSSTVYVPIEGESNPKNGYNYNSRNGQSYLFLASDGGSLNSSKSWMDTSVMGWNNVCVKAFATSVEQDDNPGAGTNPGTGANINSSTASSAGTSVHQQPTKTKITSSVQNLTLGKGETLALPVKTQPASQKSHLSWKSSNSNVVAVNANGKITAKQTGNAKITATAPSGAKCTIKITVKKAPSRVKASLKKKKLKKGKTTKIIVKLNKKSASFQIRYQSLNPKVAVVTSTGKVKAKKKGRARIRVITYNRKKAYVTVTVK